MAKLPQHELNAIPGVTKGNADLRNLEAVLADDEDQDENDENLGV